MPWSILAATALQIFSHLKQTAALQHRAKGKKYASIASIATNPVQYNVASGQIVVIMIMVGLRLYIDAFLDVVVCEIEI